jgi:DksA/TraR C4-type zinc finger protein
MTSHTTSAVAFADHGFLVTQRAGLAARRADDCRQPVPVARPEALPEATQCVSCASGNPSGEVGR